MSHSYLRAARKSLTPINRPPQLTCINSATGSADLESPHERVAACYHFAVDQLDYLGVMQGFALLFASLAAEAAQEPGVRH
jgi:hypothetical protein